MNCRWCSASITISLVFAATQAIAADAIGIRIEPRELHIELGGRPLARYVFADEAIRRPYFTDVRSPGGVEVTRRHPPREGIDATDHATMHPGIWLAFGDVNGADFWRNRGEIRHEGFAGTIESGPEFGRFTAKYGYFAGDRRICTETSTITFRVVDGLVFLLFDSRFESARAFAFGDQEEMGLGLRVATPMTVENGGQIRNSDGLTGEAGCWGKQARWAEYAGEVEGRRVGVVLMPHPENFGASWFHARDYGLLVANPFGRKAFTDGEPSRIEVAPGESIRLRFGVCVGEGAIEPERAYAAYLEFAGRS